MKCTKCGKESPLTIVDEETRVCEECLDAFFTQCDECGEYWDDSYVEQFFDVESRIIQEERKHQKKKSDSKNEDTIKESRDQIENYGDDEAKAAWADLEESYELAETPEEKSFIANKMSNLGFQAMTTNYNWLRAFFSVILSKPETKYTNAQKAEYWKSQAYLAMDSKNATQRRKAVFELLDLMTSSANQAVSAFGADLTM